MKNQLTFKHVFLFLMLFALCNTIVITCAGQLNSNVKSIRFRPAIDTATFTPHPVGTVAMHLDSLLYFYNKDSIWVPLIGGGSGGSVFANNGLHLDGDTVKLGGPLTENTVIAGGNFTSEINNTSTGGRFNQFFIDSLAVSLFSSLGTVYTASNYRYNIIESYAIGANIINYTDVAGGGGIERLKIDSVGNVDFPNTQDFDVTSTGDIQMVKSHGISTNFLLIDSTKFQTVFDRYNSNTNTVLDGNGLLHEIEGGIFNVKTSEFGNSPSERLKIDSVGYITNTGTNIQTFADVGTGGEPENKFSLDSPDLDSEVILLAENATGGGISQSGVRVDAGSNTVYMGVASDTGVGIITSINTTLQVTATGSEELQLSGNTMAVGIGGDSGGALDFLGSDGSGKVVWGVPSDSSLKKDISPLKKAYEKIMKLKPVNFTYKKGDIKTVGFIAQDVEKVLPEMVTTKRNGIKHLKTTTYLEPFIIATLQDMDRQIKALQKEVNRLKKEDTPKHRPRYKH